MCLQATRVCVSTIQGPASAHGHTCECWLFPALISTEGAQQHAMIALSRTQTWHALGLGV